MKTLQKTSLMAILIAAGCMPAVADIILLPDNVGCIGCSNILFKPDDVGNPLIAATQGGAAVKISQWNAGYTSRAGTLLAPSNGQARVEDFAGIGLQRLSIDLGPDIGATFFQFTVQPLTGGQGDATTMTVTIIPKGGTESWHFDLGSVGQNRHTWQATGTSLIETVRIEFNGLVQAVEQIRLTEVPTGGTGGGEVPEPATALAVGAGLLALALARKAAVRARR